MTLQVEEGASYTRRDGIVVGPMKRARAAVPSAYPWEDESGQFYTDAGKYFGPEEESPGDLVELFGFAPAPAPSITVQEGHVYETRNGSYAGPMAMHPGIRRWVDAQKGQSYDLRGCFVGPDQPHPLDLVKDIGLPSAAIGTVGGAPALDTGIEVKENFVYKRRDGSFCGPMRRDWNQPKGFIWQDTQDEYYTAEGLHSLLPGANDPLDIIEEVGPPAQAVGKGVRANWTAPGEAPRAEAAPAPEAAAAPASRYAVVQVTHVISLEEAQALIRAQPNPQDFAVAEIAFVPRLEISFAPPE